MRCQGWFISMYTNSELQNQSSKTLNWATLKLGIDRVFLCINVVVPTTQEVFSASISEGIVREEE